MRNPTDWEIPGHVEFLVTVAETLTMEFAVEINRDRDSSLKTCLHTYFQISGIDAMSITGLEGIRYQDKVAGPTETETAAVRIAGEVDRAYFDTATTEIEGSGYNRKIRVAKSCSNSAVVWNPWTEKSERMPDFADDEYPQVVCVESGNVGKNQTTLPHGSRAVMQVEITSGPLPS